MNDDKKSKLVPMPAQHNQVNSIGGDAVITVQFMADQAWTEGRQEFVAPLRNRNPRYQLGDDYERHLSKMTIEVRGKHWREMVMRVPHSSNAFFAGLPEFYDLLEKRLRDALARIEIARHRGPTIDQ